MTKFLSIPPESAARMWKGKQYHKSLSKEDLEIRACLNNAMRNVLLLNSLAAQQASHHFDFPFGPSNVAGGMGTIFH